MLGGTYKMRHTSCTYNGGPIINDTTVFSYYCYMILCAIHKGARIKSKSLYTSNGSKVFKENVRIQVLFFRIYIRTNEPK